MGLRFFLVLLLVSCEAFAQPYKLKKIVTDPSAGISCLATDEGRNIVIGGDEAGNLYSFDAGGRMLQTIKAHDGEVRSLSYNSTGLLLMTTSAHELKIWNAGNFHLLHSLGQQEYADIRFAVFSIADGFIYFNSGSRLYKTRSDLSQTVMRLGDFSDAIMGGVITQDRSALVFVSGNRLQVVNTRSDNVVQDLQVSLAPVQNISLMPGNRLATWSSDGTVTIWKLGLGQVDEMPLMRFKAGLSSSMAFTMDGNRMASGNIGTWTRIWDWQDRSISQELFGHTGTVTSMVFCRGDDLLFTGSKDQTIRIWSRRVEDSVPPPPPPPVQVQVPSPAKPADTTAVHFDENNLPVQVKGRPVTQSETFELNSDNLEVFVYDNLLPDGDIISLSFNGEWVLKDYIVEKTKKRLQLHLQKGNNSLVLYAENLGKSPPNTAAVEFEYQGRRKIIRLKSDLKSCSALNFVYK